MACRLARSVNFVNDQQAGAYLLQVQQGKLPIDRLDTWLQQRIIPDRDAAGHYVVYQTLDGLPLSNELLGIFYGVTVPQSVLRFNGVDGDSALGRALYEADYALKTVDMTQEIFNTIPGHRTYKQMCLDAHLGKLSPVRWTLVPQEVPLLVSADRREVGFGRAEIALDARAIRIENAGTFTDEDLAATQKLADVYKAQVTDNYERYAREYGSLHRLREAAKILALARSINEERIPVSSDLRAASAASAGGDAGLHAWTPPSRVPGLYHVFMSLAEVTAPDGRLRHSLLIPAGVEGGVSFKSQKKWVSISPMPPTYEKAASSVTTSAALGQAAVRGGRQRRSRAGEKPGRQERRGHAGQAQPGRAAGERAYPQGACGERGQPRGRSRGQGGRPDCALHGRRRSCRARDDRGPGATDAAGQSRPRAEQRRVRRPDRDEFLLDAADPPDGSGAGRAASGAAGGAAADLAAARHRARAAGLRRASRRTPGRATTSMRSRRRCFDARIAQIRQDLDRVQRAMANIGRLNQQNVADLQKWEQEVSAAYGAAEERAMDAAGLLLVDGPLEILRKRQQQMREAMDSGLVTSLLARKAAVTREEAAALDHQAFGFLKMKYRYEGVYGQAERLEQHLAGAKAGYDMDQWANGDKSDFEKMKAGMMQLAEMALGDPAIGGAISVGRITGENLLRWLSLYKAVNLAAGFLGDIVAQRLAWGPVMEQLERSIDTNRQGLEHLRQRATRLRQQLGCLQSASRGD